MRNIQCVIFLAMFGVLQALPIQAAAGKSTMMIIFTNGTQQQFNLSDVARIEFTGEGQQPPSIVSQPSPAPSSPAIPPAATPVQSATWAGHFGGSDISGYPIDITLTVQNGVVSGGYSYFHKAANKSVRAIITDTSIQGNTLIGRWKQVEGIITEGRFTWNWLPGQQGKAFEGSFDGTKFWTRMIRR